MQAYLLNFIILLPVEVPDTHPQDCLNQGMDRVFHLQGSWGTGCVPAWRLKHEKTAIAHDRRPVAQDQEAGPLMQGWSW